MNLKSKNRYFIAFGEENAEVLKACDIAGKYVRIN